LARIVNARLIAQLLEQHGDALQRYAAQWTVSPEDCVQEAIVKLAGQALLPDSPTAWLYRVVRNDAINRARGERRRVDHEQHAARLYQQRGSETNNSEDLQALTVALGNLQAAERELVTLRIWSALTWEQIGQLTNQSSSNAQRRYVAALKKIRKELEMTCPTNPNSVN
jgi:RNA polymerase sigma-70 factor (ECF subfamily)